MSRKTTAAVRESISTPLFEPGECMVMVAPEPALKLACLAVAMELELRPIECSVAQLPDVVSVNRPLVIVLPRQGLVDPSVLNDLAVSVGGRALELTSRDTDRTLALKVRLAVEAGRRIRERNRLIT